jgi:hypothetical protein
MGEKKWGDPTLGKAHPDNFDARWFGRGMGYPLVIGSKMALIPATSLLESSGKGTESWAKQMEASPEVTLTYTDESGQEFERTVPKEWLAEEGGGDAAVAASTETARDKFRASTWPKLIASRHAKVSPVKTLVQGGQDVVQKLRSATEALREGTEAGGEFLTKNLPAVGEALQVLPDTAEELSSGLKSQSQEAGRWRVGVGDFATKAAPAGAGALGGYILSQLLGPGVKKDETPSQREKRERLQRIYNLLGMTGGGGLGYYLANRFGGGGPATKTGRDVKSFKTIARLGRVSAH